MKIFLVFLVVFFGFLFKGNYLLSGLSIALIIGFAVYKFSKKYALILALVSILSGAISFIEIAKNKPVYDGFVSEVSTNYFIFISDFEPLYVYEKETKREIGDFLSIKGKKEILNFQTVESQFDFGQYLKTKGVKSTLTIERVESKFLSPLRLNEKRQKFLNLFSSSTKDFVSSILFSRVSDGETIDLFQNFNLVRLCLASGIYLSLYLHLSTKLLSYKLKEKYASILAFSLLLPYFIFVFPKFSVIKVGILFLFKYVNKQFLKNKFNYLEIVSFAGLLILFVNFHYAKQDNFILSFSISIFAYFFNNSFSFLPKAKKRFLLLLAIFTFLIPFSFSYTHAIYPFEIIGQLLFTPLITLFGILSLLCFYHIPLYSVVEKISFFIKNVLSFLGKFSFSIYGPQMNVWLILIFEVLLFLTLYFTSLKISYIRNFFLVSSLLFLSLYTIPLGNSFSSEVSFINVGQGDAILIRSKNKTALIDTGGNKFIDLAEECLIPYFKSKRIYHLDYAIITHDDFDHNGAFVSLSQNFKIKNYIDSSSLFPLQIGEITLDSFTLNNPDLDTDNDRSIIIKFTVHETRFLLMGDASTAVEKTLISQEEDIESDVLKIGHHGSKTSTSEEFLTAVNPKEAVISVGKNYYGHPHPDVISLLNRNNIKIRRTDLEGTITYRWM